MKLLEWEKYKDKGFNYGEWNGKKMGQVKVLSFMQLFMHTIFFNETFVS